MYPLVNLVNLAVNWDKDKWWVQREVPNEQGLVKALRASHMPAVRKVKAKMANILKAGSELEPLIPQEYHDLVEVFS